MWLLSCRHPQRAQCLSFLMDGRLTEGRNGVRVTQHYPQCPLQGVADNRDLWREGVTRGLSGQILEHGHWLDKASLPGQAQWTLTQGWAQSSPAHPGDSPRWAAHPPIPGPRSAWASLSSGAQLCRPTGCYSLGCHSGGSESQAAGGSSWPHLGRGREKGCSNLRSLGIQKPAGGSGDSGRPPPQGLSPTCREAWGVMLHSVQFQQQAVKFRKVAAQGGAHHGGRRLS